MSVTLNEALATNIVPSPDKNRWYLCTESQKRSQWTCKETPDLGPNTHNYGLHTNPRSIVVQLPHWSPRAADFMFINNALKQTFSVER